MPDHVGEITGLLGELGRTEGGPERERVLGQLIPLVYSELKVLARSQRNRWQGQEAPGTTSLVHEAYAKLAAQSEASFGNRHHFFALASKVMRSILIDNARWHQRLKRGGEQAAVPFQEDLLVSADRCEDLLALDEALDRLGERDAALARVVECRCFGGLTTKETAEALEISPATVKRRWSLARTWLYRELQSESG